MDAICPECMNGKHVNCDEMALDYGSDCIVPCACMDQGHRGQFSHV